MTSPCHHGHLKLRFMYCGWCTRASLALTPGPGGGLFSGKVSEAVESGTQAIPLLSSGVSQLYVPKCGGCPMHVGSYVCRCAWRYGTRRSSGDMRWFLSQARLSFQATSPLGLPFVAEDTCCDHLWAQSDMWGSQKTVGQNQSWAG